MKVVDQKMLAIIKLSQDTLYGQVHMRHVPLVKCRKVGAANLGNSTKKEEYIPEEGYDICKRYGESKTI